MNTENIKTDEPNILRLILSGELDLTLFQIGWGNFTPPAAFFLL